MGKDDGPTPKQKEGKEEKEGKDTTPGTTIISGIELSARELGTLKSEDVVEPGRIFSTSCPTTNTTALSSLLSRPLFLPKPVKADQMNSEASTICEPTEAFDGLTMSYSRNVSESLALTHTCTGSPNGEAPPGSGGPPPAEYSLMTQCVSDFRFPWTSASVTSRNLPKLIGLSRLTSNGD